MSKEELLIIKSSLLILYSSETGTSEDISYKLFYLLLSLNSFQNINILSINNFNYNLLSNETFIIFIISTTGDGEIPLTMKYFWKYLLQKNLNNNLLNNLFYGIFGLGDSGYDKFNAAARKLNSRLKQLSAKEFISIGLGDDQSPLGYLGTLDLWIKNLLNKLEISYEKDKPIQTTPQYFLSDSITQTLPSSLNSLNSTTTPQSQLNQLQTQPIQYQYQYLPKPKGGTQLMEITQGIINQNIRMSKNNWSQNIFHLSITLQTNSSERLYHAGDVLVVYFPNPSEIVNLALSMYIGRYQMIKSTISESKSELELDEYIPILIDESMQFEINKYPNSYSRENRLESGIKCSLRELFTNYLDITGVPQRSFFEQLSFYTTNSEETEKLIELSSGEGVDLYQQYCVKERRGYIEILSEFKSCEISLDRLIELIPPLHPRYYSIASSGAINYNEVQLCVALVEFTTPLKRKRYGLCSKYLSQLTVGSQITCTIRKGTFITPDISDPLILIGPGTGLAPMRALIHERYPQFSQIQTELSLDNSIPSEISQIDHFTSIEESLSSSISSISPTVLFYGCRSEDDDYLYKNEWKIISNLSTPQQQQQQLSSLNIYVAYSRKGTNNGRYVTHDIRNNALLVWNLIQQSNSRIYVSGSASTKMPSDVRKCLVEIILEYGEMSKENAEKYLLKMEREKRYCVEAWS